MITRVHLFRRFFTEKDAYKEQICIFLERFLMIKMHISESMHLFENVFGFLDAYGPEICIFFAKNSRKKMHGLLNRFSRKRCMAPK